MTQYSEYQVSNKCREKYICNFKCLLFFYIILFLLIIINVFIIKRKEKKNLIRISQSFPKLSKITLSCFIFYT